MQGFGEKMKQNKMSAFENCNCETFAQHKGNETCGLLFSSSEHDSLVGRYVCKSPIMGKSIFSCSIKSLKESGETIIRKKKENLAWHRFHRS